MVRVKKANAEYRVPDEKLEEYLAMGYAQLDDSGHVVQEGEKTGVKELRVENAALKTEIKRLNEENAVLRCRLAPVLPPDPPVSPALPGDPPKAGKKG